MVLSALGEGGAGELPRPERLQAARDQPEMARAAAGGHGGGVRGRPGGLDSGRREI